MVDRQAYLDTYQEAVQELSELIDERDQIDERREKIDKRLAEVRKGVIALVPLCGVENPPWSEHPEWFPDVESPDVGLTAAIRRVLQSDLDRFFSPVEVRDGLKDVGYEVKSKNILPSIHNTLKRLHKAGNATTDDVEGKTCYRWEGEIPASDQTHTMLQDMKYVVDAFKPPAERRYARTVLNNRFRKPTR